MKLCCCGIFDEIEVKSLFYFVGYQEVVRNRSMVTNTSVTKTKSFFKAELELQKEELDQREIQGLLLQKNTSQFVSKLNVIFSKWHIKKKFWKLRNKFLKNEKLRLKAGLYFKTNRTQTNLTNICYTSVEFLEAPRYCFSIIKTQTYIGVLFITLREIHS